MAKIAKRTLGANNMKKRITLHAKESSELQLDTDLANEPVNLIVSEIVDSELLGEGILPSIRDAKVCALFAQPPPSTTHP